jgi:hypothetical protein
MVLCLEQVSRVAASRLKGHVVKRFNRHKEVRLAFLPLQSPEQSRPNLVEVSQCGVDC